MQRASQDQQRDEMNAKTTLSGGRTPDFSLVLGGPLFQIMRRAHLTDDALSLVDRRIVLTALLCWLPLLVLSAFEGEALGGKVAVPFLLDIEVHVRFLVVVPLLIGAELIVHRRLRFVVAQFLERNLIAESDMPRFNAAVASAFRLRNSVLAEALLIAFVYLIGVLVIWQHYIAIDAVTWYAAPSPEGVKRSFAGLWFGFVSLPVFQFLLIRWYFRILIWVRFLWQVSRIDLCLVPTHPDRAGGLGFLSRTAYAFTPLLVAHGALLAGLIAARIFFAGARLIDFKFEIIVLVIFLLLLVQGPLLVFASQLGRAKRIGSRDFGLLAERYARAFDAKWLHGVPPGEPLLGNADIQSLADLSSANEIVQTMHVSLFSTDALLQLTGAIIAPILPLVLTMVPIEEMFSRLFGILF